MHIDSSISAVSQLFIHIFMDEFRSSNPAELHRTVSHEVAHGAFVLYHTFSEFPALQQGTTDNLMDYTTGTRLCKYQWDLIHDPVWLIVGGGSEEEGAGYYWDTYIIQQIVSTIHSVNKSNNGNIFDLIPIICWQKKREFTGNFEINATSISLDISCPDGSYSKLNVITDELWAGEFKNEEKPNKQFVEFSLLFNNLNKFQFSLTIVCLKRHAPILENYLLAAEKTEQNIAHSIIFNFETSETSTVFKNINKEDVISGLNERIENPNVIDQIKGTWLCGPAAICRVMAEIRPVKYATMILDLYESGEFYDTDILLKTNPFHESHDPSDIEDVDELMNVIDYISLIAIKDAQNRAVTTGVLEYEYPPDDYTNGGELNGIYASTMPDTEDLFVRLLLDVQTEYTGWCFTDCAEDHYQKLKTHIDNGKSAILFVHSKQLEENKEPYPENITYKIKGVHYITVLGFDHDDQFAYLDYQDYGEAKYRSKYQKALFNDMVYAIIYLKN